MFCALSAFMRLLFCAFTAFMPFTFTPFTPLIHMPFIMFRFCRLGMLPPLLIPFTPFTPALFNMFICCCCRPFKPGVPPSPLCRLGEDWMCGMFIPLFCTLGVDPIELVCIALPLRPDGCDAPLMLECMFPRMPSDTFQSEGVPPCEELC